MPVVAYLARDAPLGVILRRAAGGWSHLSVWHTDTDVVVPGDWLHARVFPNRADLSPDGRYFGYFAHHGAPHRDAPGWTAISRPPSFAALAWWAEDTTWTTGPCFPSAGEVWVGYIDGPVRGAVPAELTRVTSPPAVFAEVGRLTTDRTVPVSRLLRDGWSQVDDSLDAWARALPDGRRLVVIDPGRAWMHGPPDYLVEGAGEPPLGNVSWAGMDGRGRLLLLRDDRLLVRAPGGDETVVAWLRPEDLPAKPVQG